MCSRYMIGLKNGDLRMACKCHWMQIARLPASAYLPSPKPVKK